VTLVISLASILAVLILLGAVFYLSLSSSMTEESHRIARIATILQNNSTARLESDRATLSEIARLSERLNSHGRLLESALREDRADTDYLAAQTESLVEGQKRLLADLSTLTLAMARELKQLRLLMEERTVSPEYPPEDASGR
jgi:hypothetical protein